MIKVGDTLYKVRSYRTASRQIIPLKVTKIGKKYIYYEGDHNNHHGVDKNTLRYSDKEYSQRDYTLYRTEQEIYDMWEYNDLRQKFSQYFNNPIDLSLDQLRAIDQIINQSNK